MSVTTGWPKLFATSACCFAVALAVLLVLLVMKIFCLSSKLQLLTFVFYSLIVINLGCPKALPPLAISGTSWQLGSGSGFWLEECAHRIKSHYIVFFTLGFCGRREISHVPHMSQTLRKSITEWEEDSMSTVWPSPATHMESSEHCCLVESTLATISHKATKYLSLLRVVEWGNIVFQIVLLSSSLWFF